MKKVRDIALFLFFVCCFILSSILFFRFAQGGDSNSWFKTLLALISVIFSVFGTGVFATKVFSPHKG